MNRAFSPHDFYLQITQPVGLGWYGSGLWPFQAIQNSGEPEKLAFAARRFAASLFFANAPTRTPLHFLNPSLLETQNQPNENLIILD